jgi:Beta-ketoacyl synthase, N-terminal domain
VTALAIAGIGVCAAGMLNWAQARSVLQSDVSTTPEPLPRLAPDCLPPVERRRANATTRLAINAAMQAIEGMLPEDVAQMATVFSSSDGDGEVLASMLAALAQPQVVLSPTLFHNSVFNAPAGYWSIGANARAASITVSAGPASFAAGLNEVRGQVLANGAPVLYIAFDAPFPAALASFARSAEPFACALRLQPVAGSRMNGYGCFEMSKSAPDGGEREDILSAELRARFSGNAAADALPLLLSIARRRRAHVALPVLDGGRQWLDYRP